MGKQLVKWPMHRCCGRAAYTFVDAESAYGRFETLLDNVGIIHYKVIIIL